MTTSDELERRVRSWMAHTAPDREPDGLVARAVDRTASVRQRPAFLVRTGLRRRELAMPALARPAQLLFLAMLLLIVVGAMAVVGARLLTPTPSPVDTRLGLAYAFGGDVYVADWDGTDPVRIIDKDSGIGDGGSEDPCRALYIEDGLVSPDGRHIAYRLGPVGAAGSSGCRTVVISDPDGDTVASFPGVGWSVAWSPDSNRVATWLDLYPMTTIAVYGIDGVLQAELSLPPGVSVSGDHDPYWSPDGRSLLIRLSSPTASEVWELPLDGGTPRPVPADDPRWYRATAYSADGARVAYLINDSYSPGHSLVVAAADGSQAQTLVPPDPSATQRLCDVFGDGVVVEPCPAEVWMTEPVMSPSGDRVAFTVTSIGRGGGQADVLRLVDVATGELIVLATGDLNDNLRVIGFSPDGRILFRKSDANDVISSLWSVNTDGSEARMLVAGDDVEGGWLSLPADGEAEATP